MMDSFAYIRRNLDILEVARRYHLEVDRHHKALCIFHQEKRSSMSFKNNRFKCFSCGMGGSSIDLVQKIFSLEPLQAVKKINIDFGLGLDLEIHHQATMIEIQEIERKRELLKTFEHWCNKTYSEYAQIAHFYWQNMQEYKPVNEDNELHPLYVNACHQWEPVNYILDILLRGTAEEKIMLYKDLTDWR